MEDILIGITEAGKLIGRSPRRLLLRAKEENWKGIEVPGKRWKCYPIALFPPDWQRAILEALGVSEEEVPSANRF